MSWSRAVSVGIPHPTRGEVIKAYIVVKPGETLEKHEILKFCRQQLANYKVPRAVEFRGSLPKTMVGKTLRRALRAEEEAKLKAGVISREAEVEADRGVVRHHRGVRAHQGLHVGLALGHEVDARQVELNLYEEVLRVIGTPVVFNISVLGALIGMYPVVKKESVLQVLAGKFPASFMEENTKALEVGLAMGSERYTPGILE